MPHQSTQEATSGATGPAAEPKPPYQPDARSEAVAGAGAEAERPEPTVCPFCGEHYPGGDHDRCTSCGAFTDPLSRQATQNEMGPWFIRDPGHPFRPGCRLETLERMVRTGKVKAETVLRGPSTHQNWSRADRVPGVARLLGRCHACHGGVSPDEVICGSCGTGLTAERDRQHLGLAAVRAIPGRARPAEIARSLVEPDRVLSKTSRPSRLMNGPAPVGGIVSPPDSAAALAGVSPNLASQALASASRNDRRLRAAQARASVAVMLAVLFAALFALSMFMGGAFGFAPENDPPAGISQDATPEAADDLMD